MFSQYDIGKSNLNTYDDHRTREMRDTLLRGECGGHSADAGRVVGQVPASQSASGLSLK